MRTRASSTQRGRIVIDVGLGAGVAVVERSLLLALAPEDLVVAVAVEGRVDVDEVDAVVGELGQLLEVVAAVDDAGVEEGGGARGLGGVALRGGAFLCFGVLGRGGGLGHGFLAFGGARFRGILAGLLLGHAISG